MSSLEIASCFDSRRTSAGYHLLHIVSVVFFSARLCNAFTKRIPTLGIAS